MADDEFRIEIDLHDALHGLADRLRALDLDDEVAERLGGRVIVTRDGEKMYAYARTAEAAQEAERVIRQVLAEDGIDVELRRRRWNPAQRFWQDADEPLAEADESTPPDPAKDATGEDVPHPAFVYIEGHQPEFLRDL
jgi:UTP:GlnB (protein PII) uridylyltransferase